jgi:ABC-type nitrate/sulfonate/bicarbonate transport system ATPase subunit
LTLLIVTHAIEEAAFLGRKILLLGHPPNTQAEVILNPQAGQPGYRNSQEYMGLIIDLRSRIGEHPLLEGLQDEAA